MTCIVGIEHKGTVYIGADSAGIAGNYVCSRADAKVFENGKFLIGFAGSFRVGQLLKYKFVPPDQPNGVDDHRFMVVNYIDSFKKILLDNGITAENSKSLVGYKGRLYQIDVDLQVGEPGMKYDSIGIGQQVAMGVLYATPSMAPHKRINMALQAATVHNPGVSAPYAVLKKR